MQSRDVGFLVDDAGNQLAIPTLQDRIGHEQSDDIDYALRERGFVLLKPAHRVLLVELCPQKVAPLAALEASYLVRQMMAEYVVLGLVGDTWRRQPYELLGSTNAASKKIRKIACSANKRSIARLKDRRQSALTPEIELPLGLSLLQGTPISA
jgi:hypothetical protein